MHDPRLTPPQLPPRYASRPRLIRQLDLAPSRPLTLLSAGPGAGKTVLLADWARHIDAKVVWLSLARADAEPRRFWRLLTAALQETHDANRDGSVPMPRRAGGDLVQTMFGAALDGAAQLVVVIDDAHLLTHGDVLEGLDSLIRAEQPGLRLVLAARSDPLLPLHRYRLAGLMRELRAADLAMTSGEIAEVLAAHHVTLAPREFGLLAARTEGWVAGVRLSAMRMEGTEYPADFVSELAMDPGSIGEYLVEEVLSRLPEPQRQLLIQTSFLDEVTGPLADAVTGMTGSGEMLADLARDNAFVIPLDAARSRYRYHQLFTEILRYLLQRSMRAAVSELQERAAAWFEASGDLSNAIYWAAHMGDRSRVATLLARGGLAQAFVHRQDLLSLGLQGLLPLLPAKDAGAAQVAEFAVASSVIEAISADAESAVRGLERLPDLGPDSVIADPELMATLSLTELILGQKACDITAVDAAADRLLGRDGDTLMVLPDGARGAILLAQASAHLWHASYENVGALLEEALADAEKFGPRSLELDVLAVMAFVNACWSRTNHADDVMQRAQELRDRWNLAFPPMLELAAAMRALIAGDVGGQAQTLAQVLTPDSVGSDPGLAIAVALMQCRLLLADGQHDEALGMLREADRKIPPGLAANRDIMWADVDTSVGRPRAALRRLQPYSGGEFAIMTALARSRAHLALGDLRSSQDCVRSVLVVPDATTGRLAMVEALLCDAQIAQLGDEPGRALELLVRALEIARGEIVLPFVAMHDTFTALLAKHPAVATEWPVPHPRVSPDPAGSSDAASPRALPEPLTQREMTILRFLATSMSTTEIADELCLSVNTVKTHLAAIYRKLPASRRREAVLRARDLELI